jgi:transcriptional repressor OPI1
MMRGVTGVVKDSLDRAEAWVTRLRVVGLQSASDTSSPGSAQIESEAGPENESLGYIESGYATPNTISTSSSKTISRSNTTTTSEWSVPSTPGEPADAASPGAIVTSGIGELSLSQASIIAAAATQVTQKEINVEVFGMDVDA